jgi:hypothetical protein
MSNDPRLSILLPLFDHRPGFTATVLHSLDAVDGLRRALTPGTPEHEAAVERLAWTYQQQQGWNGSHSDRIRAVLAALRDLA